MLALENPEDVLVPVVLEFESSPGNLRCLRCIAHAVRIALSGNACLAVSTAGIVTPPGFHLERVLMPDDCRAAANGAYFHARDLRESPRLMKLVLNEMATRLLDATAVVSAIRAATTPDGMHDNDGQGSRVFCRPCIRESGRCCAATDGLGKQGFPTVSRNKVATYQRIQV